MSKINIKKLNTNLFGDKYFLEINGAVFDNVGATATFNKVFNENLNQKNTLFIGVGSDSGLLVSYLQKYQTNNGRSYIILERPELIQYIEKNISFDKKLINILPIDTDFSSLKDRYTDYIVHGRFILFKSLAVIDDISPQYKKIWHEVHNRFNIFQSNEIGDITNNIFVDSQLKNLALNEIPLQKIKGLLKGLTAVILGGGPSLDENIIWVKKNQHKLIIFAAARIADRLKKEGISVDFFVTIDPHEVSYDNSKSILLYSESSILIHSNSANAKLLAEWKGLRAYLGLRFPWSDSKHPQPTNLNSAGPTVANAMAIIAGYLGAKQIIFSGVDFCFSKYGQSHESNSIESKLGKYIHVADNQVITYSGRIAETNPNFAAARQAMEGLIDYVTNNYGSVFYTLSKETAVMAKLNYSATKKIQLTTLNKFKIIKRIKHNLQFSLKNYKNHIDDAKNYCQEMRGLCKKTASLAGKGQKLTKQLFIDEDETEQLTHKIINIQKNLDKLMGEHANFIFSYSRSCYEGFMDPSIKLENMTKDEIKISFTNYFAGLISSTNALHKSIIYAITRLNHRIDETKGLKHIIKLIDNWQFYNEEGRINAWLKINEMVFTDIPKKHQETIKLLLETYQKNLHNTNTKLSKTLETKASSMVSSFNRIYKYFNEKRADDLELLIKYIAEKNEENATNLYRIGLGYLYELKNMPDEAVQEYLAIKDSKLLMNGLQRIVSITLTQENYSSALDALEVLINYSDEYYVAYADVLSATGDVQGAIKMYTHYLQSYDKDITTWIKLAKLLIHNNFPDEAIDIINQIKILDSKSCVADELMVLVEKEPV